MKCLPVYCVGGQKAYMMMMIMMMNTIPKEKHLDKEIKQNEIDMIQQIIEMPNKYWRYCIHPRGLHITIIINNRTKTFSR